LGVNLFILGYAWQRGLVPLSESAIQRAIELNKTAVDFNREAFRWGRQFAHDPDAIRRMLETLVEVQVHHEVAGSLDEVISRRVEFLTAYQDAAYATRYETLVRSVIDAELRRTPGFSGLADAVARNLFKLMAYKDEYEVARLYCDTGFLDQIGAQF